MRYLVASRSWREIFGLANREITGCVHYDIFPNLPESWRESYRLGLMGQAVCCEEDHSDGPDGSAHWTRCEILPWHLDDGEVGGIAVSVEDVTRSKEAQLRLEVAATVLKHASDAVVVTDLRGNIVEVNDSFARMSGYARAELVGRNPKILKSGLQEESFYVEMWRGLKETGGWCGKIWNRSKSGVFFAVRLTITTVGDEEGNPKYYVGLAVELTPLKEQAQKLERLSRFDALTGLPNGMFCLERLGDAMAESRQTGRSLMVAVFDLDGFKQVNGQHGREAANAIFIGVASRMKQELGDDDLLARAVGDELVLMSPNLGRGDASTRLLSRLLEVVAQPHCFDGEWISVTASAGATFFTHSEDVDAEQLMRQADRAMCEAKLAGRNRWQVFDPGRDQSVRGYYEEINQIRSALRNNELRLRYQPRVNMATGEVVGAEALLRWQHPERGLLPPGLFLPAIEQSEVIVEVGDWVLREALRQASAWAREGNRISVSVNISPMQLERADFVERLQRLLEEYPEVSPSLLELELLETSALKDLAGVSSVVKACQALGISVSIDDFGTGYSSLSYLKRLPANVLKIDQSFVRDMLEDPDDLAILQGVLSLASAFRRQAVAEGVESVEHGVLLLKLGCRLAQGYAIARPMAAEDLPEWQARWQPYECWRSVRPLSPLDWPILVVSSELRSWNQAFTAYIRGESETGPEMDERLCRFGAWLERERDSCLTAMPLVERMEKQHTRAHRVGQEAVRQKAAGRNAEALQLMNICVELRDDLRRQLKLLMLGDAT